jgi:hypothetical protein
VVTDKEKIIIEKLCLFSYTRKSLLGMVIRLSEKSIVCNVDVLKKK